MIVTLSMTYNAAGDLLTTTDPTAETVTFAYDAAGRRATATDERGKVTTYTYNTAGELLTRQHPGTATESFTPGPILRTAAAQSPEGVAETFAFDDDGYLTGITDAATATTAFGYDTVGRVDEITDRTGLITTLGYDAAGAVASITDPVGTTTYGRDGFGRTTTVTAPDGGVTTTTYTPAGRVASITDARNKTTTHSYDNLGRLATVTNPLGGVTAYTYDADSRVVSVTTPANRTTSYTYDAANRVIATTDGTGAVWARTYTTRGELATEVNPDLTTVSYTWNPTGQLASVTDENNNTTSYGYDDRGNRVSRTDAASHVWSWAFDDDDRLISQTTPLGKTTTFTYDTVGRIDTVTDPDGRTETYGYDAEGRVTSRTYGGGVTTITYTYNAAGQLDTMVDVFGTTRYTYDPAGRVASIRRPGGPTTSYEYDLAGNRTRMEFPDATFSTYTYDDNGRLKTVTHNQLGAATYNYDPDGNVWSEELSNNTRRAWSYDGAGRVSAFREGPVGGAQPLTTITRDNRGQVTSMTGHETGTFTYDDAGQLLTATGPGSATTRAFTYDSRGHTTAITQAGVTRTVLIDADGRLTKIGWGNSTLDDSGNHTVIWLHNFDRVTTTFNNRGLPAKVHTRIGSVTTTETRTYDGHDRLARVEIDDGTPETFDFVWDEALPLAEIQSWKIAGAPGAATRFVYGHGRIGTVDPAGTAAVHTETALGDTQTSLATADTTHSSTFGPFGEAPFTLTPAFGYRGELTIGHGVHLRARDYLPSVARFTEPDPLDGVDGTPVVASRYHYGDNDPTNRSDPTGMRTDLDAELRDLLGLRSQQQNRARRDAFQAVGLGAAVDAFDSLEACGRSLTSGSLAGCPDGLTIVAGFVPGADCVAFVRSPSFGDGMFCAIDAASMGLGGTAIRAGSIGVDHLRHSDEIADVIRWTDDTPHLTRAPRTVNRFADDAAVLCRTNSFVPGTAVLMADGSSKSIEAIEIGDYVWATDPETGEAGPRRVTDTIVGDGEKLLVDVQVDGDVITATDQHPFWVDDQGRWIDAGDLEAGDQLELPGGTTIAVEAVAARVAVQRVHNLTVDGIHTYHVLVGDDPVLVHNCSTVDRAAELRARAGRNRVSIETSTGRMSIDLQGRSHYERTIGSAVETPHVKFETRHVGPNGQVSYTTGPVRPATFDDLRLVDRILRERGL